MATAASLTLDVWRNDEVYEFPLRVRGPDLTGAAMRAQVRLAPDTPGTPLVDLALTTNGNAEGIRLAGVSIIDGVNTNDVRIRLNKSTRQALPYGGERGDAAVLAFAFQIAGRTRLYGNMRILASAIDSDAAPANRPPSYGASISSAPAGGAVLAIADDDVVVLTIDGADLIGPLVSIVEDARDDAVAAQAEVIAIRDEFAVLVDGRRLPALTTEGASYYGIYSTERLIDGVGPLIEMADGAGGPPNSFGDKQESVTPVSAQIARATSAAARISRVYDQIGSGRDLAQTDASRRPAAVESITTNGVLAIVVDGKRAGSVTVPIARGLRMTGWSLPARNNTRFMVVEPTVSVAKQLYERWENSNAAASDRNLYTSSSDAAPLSPDVGGNLQYAGSFYALVPSSPFVIAITESATGTDIWFNDVKIANPAIPADGALANGYLGYGPDGGLQAFNSSCRYLAYGAVNGALNDADILAIYKQLAARFNLDPEEAPRIVLIGDSIGEGTQTTYGQNIIYFMRRLLKKRCRIYNLALSGNAMEWAYARRATLEGVLYQGNRRCVAVLQGGINDIQGLGRTGAELYNNTIVPYISYLKGLGYKVVVCTLLPQTAANVSFAEPQRVAYNNLVRANSGGADVIADLAGDPTVGVHPTSADDVTLYADKIHPTARGYAYQAPIYANALNGVL